MKRKYKILQLLNERGEMASRDIVEAIGGYDSTTYAAINALKYDGDISQRWEETQHNPIRLFKITEEGQRELRRAKLV